MEKYADFVALDFELFTSHYISACAIGLVKVKNNVIVEKYYSLINPVPDEYTFKEPNTPIHGLSLDMVKSAPNFGKLFPKLVEMIGDLPIVCHNRSCDINVLRDCMKFFNLEGINIKNNICTYELTGLSLPEACKKYGITIGNHHDALDDATACAKVYMACSGNQFAIADKFKGGLKQIFAMAEARKMDREVLDPINDDCVANKETPFFHASVVITGTFDAYPNRNDLAKILQSLGADINTAISGKTNVVVLGHGAGPSKLKKIEDLQAKGKEIKIIYEPELLEILQS